MDNSASPPPEFPPPFESNAVGSYILPYRELGMGRWAGRVRLRGPGYGEGCAYLLLFPDTLLSMGSRFTRAARLCGGGCRIGKIQLRLRRA